ncbi:MAG: hypothetical protein DMF53_27265 [Acidobacteria bacterium]|nr:MAG: hypothetical protein DMF53_27265 [Acidobacteriota bacterium]
MARLLRFIPAPGSLVEVTTRTIQSRPLLTPSPLFNRIFIGVLARASRRHKVGVVAYVCLSDHYHLLVRVDDADQLARFMELFNSKLAREVAKLTGWKDKIWSERYKPILVSTEEAAQVARLLYLLSNSCKENLVAEVGEWPGPHCAPALLTGQPLQGVWINRTQEYRAQQRGETPEPQSFEEPETLTLEPLGAEAADWQAASRGRGHPAAGPDGEARAHEEVSSPALPCLQPSGPRGSLSSLLGICRCLPCGGGEAEIGRPPCGVSDRELSTPPALRQGIAVDLRSTSLHSFILDRELARPGAAALRSSPDPDVIDAQEGVALPASA